MSIRRAFKPTVELSLSHQHGTSASIIGRRCAARSFNGTAAEIPAPAARLNYVHRRPFHISSPNHGKWQIAPPELPAVHPSISSSSPARPPCSHITTAPSSQLRELMRLVTHSVIVCTSTMPAGSPTLGTGTGTSSTTEPTPMPSPRAMTMSSFTSLSLDPTPVVALNIALPSRTLDAVAASGQFNVHILAGDAQGARVADWFTRGNIDCIDAGDEKGNGDGNTRGGLFDRRGLEEGCGCTAVMPGPSIPPSLVGEGILYILKCRLLEEPSGGLVRVRDHVMVLGEVEEVVEGMGRSLSGGTERFGLIYADRKYRQLGNTMVKEDD